ncbi:juvenile hormone esterase isoform X2 [Plodia interpunctella]|uniref:juvenile hormone esterase isoform X2 n=1 Tax=Plodia interpunctella TaxID=58824 RepID=UPI002367780E|nr:juvenile hormone esterase-like isoform X2 [Plodia interpunctella]
MFFISRYSTYQIGLVRTAGSPVIHIRSGGRMTEAPIVKVEQGELQGCVVTSPSGKAFYSFQGIPYAKPPLGSLRFKAPQPPESWEGVRDATSEGNISAQIDPQTKQYVGDENCLFLNIYTNNLDGSFLPVMLYVHGGGFRFGSGSSSLYGGDYLVEKDVVVVTINYRCGALGFLSLNTAEVPGNAGLKDVVQAIRWVKENIHNFGGNPGNLTVFGESCGGVATSVLTASPLTKNLISKAIIQSGTGLNSWAFQRNPVENARSLAKNLGCDAEDVNDILEFLATTPVKDIVEANERMQPPDSFFEKGSILFALVVEKEFPDVEAVITEAFIDVLTSGRTAEIPIMIGSTALEFTFERTNEDLQSFIPDNLRIEKNTPESVAIADRIKSLYFKGNHTGVESLNEYFELLSDKLVNIDTHRYVQYLVKVSTKPLYYYKFDYVGELNLTKKLLSSLGLKHAGHMDELGYLFKNDLQSDVEPTQQDLRMRERMLSLWTNFAKTGNPTPDENKYITVEWLPVNKDHLYYLNLGEELSLGTNPDKEKMEFWDDLYNKHYRIWEHPKTNNDVDRNDAGDVAAVVYTETVVEPVDDPQSQVEAVVIETTVVEAVDTKESEVVVVESEPEIVGVVVNEQPNVEPAKVEENNDGAAVETAYDPPKFVENAYDPPKVVETAYEPAKNGDIEHVNGDRKVRTSNEIKMVQNANGVPKDVIRANDPPEDDLPKNIGVNKFVNFFESLGGKK